ncbi:putative NADPH-dependent methylglyoxal reductase GRP2 [Spathaspora sp. JA1]|nr:putative NADPH-dependent methylglyoxal reductase GRP2 [Spathaspora sp. JA1]
MAGTTVFVSGANGYIAQHIVKQLLAKGYSVVGSVRSSSKGEDLKALVNSDKFSYEVVPALGDKGAFDDALKKHPEVTVFLHTASPVSFSVKDIENDLLRPAIDGTVNALQAIKDHAPQVKKVVITSSAVANLGFGNHFDGKKIYNEDDWNPITYKESLEDPTSGYFGSKKFAELAAIEFVEKEKPHFSVTFVNPVYVFGPQAYGIKDKSQLNLSAEVVNGVVKLGKNDKIATFGNLFVDVRDVARAHLVAFENEQATSKRIVVYSNKFSLDSIAHIINENFPDSSVPKGDISKNTEIDKTIQKFDTSKSNNILGYDFIPLEKSVVDTVQQIYSV